MRVVVVADRLFASRERELLSRLEIGLADEGVRVLQALPEEGAAAAQSSQAAGVFTATLTFPSGGLPFTTGLRARRLAQRLEEVDSGADDSPVDIVHVFGGSLWPFGAALAEACGAGLALEVWRAGLIDRTGTIAAAAPKDVLFIAPDPEIERAPRQRGGGVATRLAIWGVHAGDPPAPKLVAGRAPTVMLIGAGNDPRAMRAALEGVANCVRAHPDMLIFADALAARRADLYALAMQRGILANLSLIEEIESRRDLLVQGDVLLLCEGNGEQRTIVLEKDRRISPRVCRQASTRERPRPVRDRGLFMAPAGATGADRRPVIHGSSDSALRLRRSCRLRGVKMCRPRGFCGRSLNLGHA